MSENDKRNIMIKKVEANEFTATDLRIALNEVFPESTYGAIPVIDQYDALETYLASDDDTKAEAPVVLAAYITHMQHWRI